MNMINSYSPPSNSVYNNLKPDDRTDAKTLTNTVTSYYENDSIDVNALMVNQALGELMNQMINGGPEIQAQAQELLTQVMNQLTPEEQKELNSMVAVLKNEHPELGNNEVLKACISSLASEKFESMTDAKAQGNLDSKSLDEKSTSIDTESIKSTNNTNNTTSAKILANITAVLTQNSDFCTEVSDKFMTIRQEVNPEIRQEIDEHLMNLANFAKSSSNATMKQNFKQEMERHVQNNLLDKHVNPVLNRLNLATINTKELSDPTHVALLAASMSSAIAEYNDNETNSEHKLGQNPLLRSNSANFSVSNNGSSSANQAGIPASMANTQNVVMLAFMIMLILSKQVEANMQTSIASVNQYNNQVQLLNNALSASISMNALVSITNPTYKPNGGVVVNITSMQQLIQYYLQDPTQASGAFDSGTSGNLGSIPTFLNFMQTSDPADYATMQNAARSGVPPTASFNIAYNAVMTAEVNQINSASQIINSGTSLVTLGVPTIAAGTTSYATWVTSINTDQATIKNNRDSGTTTANTLGTQLSAYTSQDQQVLGICKSMTDTLGALAQMH